METKIENLKAELQKFIELSKLARSAPWTVDGFEEQHGIRAPEDHVVLPDRSYLDEQDAVFIARSRNISPVMAKCLLAAINGLEAIRDSLRVEQCDIELWDSFNTQIKQILTIWEAAKV